MIRHFIDKDIQKLQFLNKMLDELYIVFKVALDNSDLEIGEDGPLFSPIHSIETLQNHFMEANSQLQVI